MTEQINPSPDAQEPAGGEEKKESRQETIRQAAKITYPLFPIHIKGNPMFNKGQLAGLMKQAQAMQDNLKKAQDELAFVEVEGQAGSGMVKVLMTCKHNVRRVTIDPSLLADDKDMLEDLVAAAFNDAVRMAEEVSQQKMGKLTAGLPPGMKLPF